MKTVLAILLFFLGVVLYSQGIDAKSYAVMEYNNGRVIYSKNPDLKLPMASTTKIMTGVCFLDSGRNKVIYGSQAKSTPYPNMNFPAGTYLSRDDAMKCLMISSSNDVAVAMGLSCGDMNDFLDIMNVKAFELGMKNTHYANIHGLDVKGHYSTVSDTARLAEYAWHRNDFRKYILPKADIYPVFNGKTTKKTVHSTFEKFYSWGIKGIKTGTTANAGKCFVGFYDRKPCPVITVVFGSRNAEKDTKKLIEYTYKNSVMHKAADTNRDYNLRYRNMKIASYVKENVSYFAPKSEKFDISLVSDCQFPIIKNHRVGTLTVKSDGEILKILPLYSRKNYAGTWTDFVISFLIVFSALYISVRELKGK